MYCDYCEKELPLDKGQWVHACLCCGYTDHPTGFICNECLEDKDYPWDLECDDCDKSDEN